MRRFGLAGVALALVIVLAGCTAGPIATPANETATPTATVPPAIQNATADTYEFSYNATLTNSAGPLNVTADGAVDRSDRRFEATYEYGDPIDRTVTVVTIKNQTYHRENGTWTRYEPDDSTTTTAWDGDMLARQRALWNASNTSRANESTTSVSAGTETVTLNVTNRSVVEDMLRSEPFGLPDSVYLTNATYRIQRRPDGPVTQVDLHATIVESNTEGTIDARLRFSDHGQPVSIATPPIADES